MVMRVRTLDNVSISQHVANVAVGYFLLAAIKTFFYHRHAFTISASLSIFSFLFRVQ